MAVLFLSLLFCLASRPALCDNSVSEIKQAELTLEDNFYVLSAEVKYHFSKKALNALQNGVPLFWVIQVEIQQQRNLLWNNVLAEKEIRYRIQYHALLNLYRVKNLSTGEVYNFSTLAAALDLMSSIKGLPIIASNLLDFKEDRYRAALRVLFNRNDLPLPLRPIAYLNPQWYLSSDWHLWPLTK